MPKSYVVNSSRRTVRAKGLLPLFNQTAEVKEGNSLHIVTYDGGNLSEDISLNLTQLLVEVIADGGSMGFLADVTVTELTAFWTLELSKVQSDMSVLVCAMDADSCIAVGILTFEAKANGRHRAEVRKMMTHPQYRHMGIASQILRRLEAVAFARGVRLLTLKTETGSVASVLYSHMGWTLMGGIPNYAAGPDRSLHSVSFYYKELSTT